AGKGVRVTSELAEAEAFVCDCLIEGRFGAGGSRVVLEEYLEGEEVSIMAVCDGEHSLLLPAARDHKRAFDGDRGANTGGMGAYAPSPAVSPQLEREVTEQIVQPVLQALASRGTPYRGALYCGLMLTAAGPRVIEFNARFGDPETQCILPLVTGSFSSLLASAADGALEPATVGRTNTAAVTVAIVADGYPDAVAEGGEIFGLDALGGSGLLVFHAGAAREGSRFLLKGGRAAHVAAVADSIDAARTRVYQGIGTLSGSGWRVRRDIGASAMAPAMRPMR
ncbi:MAG: phosphoribosylamine--glycine ligase, partial [Candidatus Eisenbacteria bacterium]